MNPKHAPAMATIPTFTPPKSMELSLKQQEQLKKYNEELLERIKTITKSSVA